MPRAAVGGGNSTAFPLCNLFAQRKIARQFKLQYTFPNDLACEAGALGLKGKKSNDAEQRATWFLQLVSQFCGTCSPQPDTWPEIRHQDGPNILD